MADDAAEAWQALGALRGGGYLPDALNPRIGADGKALPAPAPKTHLRAWDWEVTVCGRVSALVAVAADGEYPTCLACLRAGGAGLFSDAALDAARVDWTCERCGERPFKVAVARLRFNGEGGDVCEVCGKGP